MEWLGWVFSLPLVGWLIKEVCTNIAQTRIMKKQSENEHLYFKKRLVFETKNDIYRELNDKVKMMIGSFNDYRNVEKIITLYYPEKLEQYIEENGYKNIRVHTEAHHIYKNDEEKRAEINLNYHFSGTKNLQFEFSNYVSLQNYILTEKENEILMELNNIALELIDYIEQWGKIWKKETSYLERKREIIEFFNDDYDIEFSKLNNQMYVFMEEIRKEMFM